jgi:ATP-binding cassette, subfamily B, bacterial PglK
MRIENKKELKEISEKGAYVKLLKTLWRYLSASRRKQFWLLLILMIVASFAEVVSVGSVLPFLGVLVAPDQVYQHPFAQPLIQMLELTEPSQLVLPLTVLFIVAALVAATIRLILLYVLTRLSFAIGADLSIDIYRRTLHQEYSVHVMRNSSEVVNGIITKTGVVIGGVISPVLNLISSIVLIVGVMAALFTINIVVALTAFLGFGSIYWLVIYYTKAHLKNNSQCISIQSTAMVKALQEGLGGIRDVLIDGSQKFYHDLYRNADLPLRRASGNNQFIVGSPKYVMEAIGMVIIAVLAYMTTQEEGGVSTAIPMLGALALGAQRLLPVLQQAYGSYSTLQGAKSSFIDVLELLGQPLPDYIDESLSTPIAFKKEIDLKKVSFRYSEKTPWILKNVNLKIMKGARIGFIGATGSGKSTLLDIVMGLLSPTSGEFSVDGQPINNKNKRKWQLHIAHVPQKIYLSDSTIEENIAFGVPKKMIDNKRVKKAASQAKISELIEGWEAGYKTLVGENGVRLSGGQHQRIGIARALYKQADVLIFDEATSALDNETEQAVMESIEELSEELTILIIAHRVTTLKKCDKIIKLDNNQAHFERYMESSD